MMEASISSPIPRDATAVDRDDYLARCTVYIDLNMVRAGAVSHPWQWEVSAFREIQQPPKRYRIIDLDALQRLLEIDGLERLQQTLAEWVADALHRGELQRDPVWSESVAVGNREFLEACRRTAGALRHREIDGEDGHLSLRELAPPYNVNSGREIEHLSGENRRFLGNMR